MSDAAFTGVRREWALVLVAVQALTRVPVPAPFPGDWPEGALRRATRYFPLVGLGVGLVAAGVFGLARTGLPPVVAALLSLAATLLLTGALHEDGLADCCDGLFGGRGRAAALAIMRDSRVGAFGVLGLIVVLGVKVAVVASLEAPGAALVAGHAAGRFFAVLPPVLLPYARTDGMAAGVAGPGRTEVLLAAAFGLGPLLLLGARAGAALLAAAAVAGLFAWWAGRRLGGYTGDVLGATQVLAEVAVLLAAAWRL